MAAGTAASWQVALLIALKSWEKRLKIEVKVIRFAGPSVIFVISFFKDIQLCDAGTHVYWLILH
jgi:hypothetical protein